MRSVISTAGVPPARETISVTTPHRKFVVFLGLSANTRAAGGNTEEALQHTEWVGRLARALVGSPEAAEDLAQDAWEAAVSRGAPPPSELRAWMTEVLRNLAAMGARTAARRRRRELAAASDESVPLPDELVDRIQTQQLVARLMLELSEPVRLVLFLRYFEGLSAKEISQRLGLPAGTVRWRLKSGVDELRERLDRSFQGDRRRWMGLVVPAAALLRPPAAVAAGGFLPGVLLMKANKVVVGMGVCLAAILVGAG